MLERPQRGACRLRPGWLARTARSAAIGAAVRPTDGGVVLGRGRGAGNNGAIEKAMKETRRRRELSTGEETAAEPGDCFTCNHSMGDMGERHYPQPVRNAC
jgi:hypothetical protein